MPYPETRRALYHHAPGPNAAASVFQSCDWSYYTKLVPKLVGPAARAIYTINKTPAAECSQRIPAIADAEFLVEIATRDTRSTALMTVLQHPLVPLGAVAAVRTRGRSWRGSPTIFDVRRALCVAAARHADEYGAEATLEFLDALEPKLTIGEYGAVVAALPRTYTDPEFVSTLLDRPDRLLEYLDAERLTECTPEVVRVLVSSRELARRVADFPELLDRDPGLVDLLFERCVTETDRVAREVAQSLASRPLDHVRFERLAVTRWAGSIAAPGTGEPEILAELARNPSCPSAVLVAQPVEGSPMNRAYVLGRLLAERVGDDAHAFALAASLLETFVGTYGELCALVEATLA